MYKKICAVVFLALAFSTPTVAKQSEKWHNETVQNFQKYWTVNNSGSKFIIWCNPDRNVSGTLIDIKIDGQTAPPGTRIRVVIDNDMIKLPSDANGYIQTSCATCADSFRFLWNRLRSSVSLAVKFEDDRYADFSLRGASRILPGPSCPTDFEK